MKCSIVPTSLWTLYGLERATLEAAYVNYQQSLNVKVLKLVNELFMRLFKKMPGARFLLCGSLIQVLQYFKFECVFI